MSGDASECTAVILPPTALSFHQIAGLPIVQRVALSALRGGFEAVVALAPGDGAALRAVFARDPRTAAIPIISDPQSAAIATERVALIPSSCVVTAGALSQVRQAPLNGAPVRFGRAEGGIVVGPRSLVGAGAAPAPAVASLGGELCLPVASADDAAAAERALLATLGSPSDGPIARFDRAVSTRISRHLVRTPLRPNHITTIGTLVGLTGAWGLAHGSYAWELTGALLFWLAVIIDGCDGEVARLKFLESRFGYLYDITTDNIVHAAIFAGMGIGLYRADPTQPFLLLGGLLVGGLVAATAATMTLLVPDPPGEQPPPRTARGRWRRRLLRGFEALMNRDFAYLLLLLAVLGKLHWFLWGAAFGTYVYAGALVLVYRWRDAD
ncbi:MAG TPA: CDP-alcohol phosphatidyltransferase family protein [Candidatus Dormibacteraeota bacterium]|nr:CDP-alcohol phosphatidyltransferase family protein [Candidatus Dormibacteraeota bacterium]